VNCKVFAVFALLRAEILKPKDRRCNKDTCILCQMTIPRLCFSNHRRFWHWLNIVWNR